MSDYHLGAQQTDAGVPGGTPTGSSTPPAPGAGATLTQEQVNAIVAEERRKKNRQMSMAERKQTTSENILQALADCGVKLTVVEMGDRMVPRMMDEVAGAMIRRWCEGKGVQVRTGRRVVSIDPAGKALLITLDDGETVEVDVLINATGVKPNVDFLAGSGVALDIGVLVNDSMQTSVAGIYAAGDVAEAIEFGTGRRVVNAIQPDAVEQARIAALNMAGQSAALPGTFVFNVLDTMGLISASFGQWQEFPGCSCAQLLDEAEYRYLRLVFDGEQLVGANSIGHTENIGVLRGLIQGRVRLGDWKARLLANPLLLSEAYLARGLAATPLP